jgi:signal transduction histidine kinase/ligand-binding sensor domain-containing protein
LNFAGYIARGFFSYLVLPATLGFTCLYGQSPHSLIEYTTENGLSLNSVNDLHFDKQGFLWVTTADGLQRFDGYHFQTFKHDPLNKSSLPENSVSTIFEDQSGNLWISHRTGVCFKPKGKNEFVDLSTIMTRFTFRYPLTCVNETDSTVWILNYPSGVFSVNKISLQIKKLYDLPGFSDQILIYPISRMYTKGEKVWFKKRLDKGGDLFMFSDNGVKQFRNIKRMKVFFLIPSKKDSLVIISDKGMYKASANDPFTPVRIVRTGFDSTFFDNELLFLPRKIGNDQWLLLGAKNILLYDANKEDVTLFPSGEYLPGELSHYLHTATADRHQNSWLGFNGIGGIKVITLQKFNLFNRPVKNALTYTLATDQKGKVFAGIYLGDVEVYDKEGRFIQTIKLPESHKKKLGSPRAMAMIDSVTLIVRSTLNELYAIDTRNGSLQLLSTLLPPRSDSVSMDFESAMQNIGKEEIWFSYANSVLSLKKSKSGFSCTTLCTLPVKEHITSIHISNTGQQWIGTISGAWLFVRKDSSGEKNNFQKTPLPHTYVKHINQHRSGKIWIATTNGIYILQQNRVLKHLNTKDGLPNSFVYSVLFDNEGNSWVSTNRGLAKIDTAFRITSYSAKEGLQGDEFNTKGYCKTNDGTLYFAGVNGINFFKPGKLVNKSAPSPTMLTKIEVNNLPYRPELQAEFVHAISLSHRENNIRLSFSCMDFTVPEKNQYRFWLKGFQDGWSLPQTNNTVQYILPVGEYELHVLGANYEGVWGKEPLIFKINILPPWYQTNWAKAIFAFLILSIVAAVFYFISRNRYQKKLRKLQMEQEVQKEKQRLSRDLHDNLGSQITWLSNNISQIERAEQELQPVENKLSQLKEGTGELMQTLRETIWILNKDKISGIDLFDKIVSLAARHIEAYPPMQLQTEEKIQSNIALNSGQALQIFRICQEAINNAFKHSQATILSIKATSSSKHFTISVSDNGKGFVVNENIFEGHYGLQNMKERARESNMGLKIESSPVSGTSITISRQ